MKIRLAIVDTDEIYLEKILNYFTLHYSDRLEISIFSGIKSLRECIGDKKPDVILINEKLEKEAEDIIGSNVAFMASSAGVHSMNGVKVICKYQKPDNIYKEVLNLYSEQETSFAISFSGDNRKTSVILFTAASGGAGATTASVAYARKRAAMGKKVLYYNREKISSVSSVFGDINDFHFEDVIYAIKSKKVNLSLKIESLIHKDITGVYSFGDSDNALVSAELSMEEAKELLRVVVETGQFDEIVIDGDEYYMDNVQNIVVVVEKSEIGIEKWKKLYNTYAILEKNEKYDILSKLYVIYNKVTTVNVEKPDIQENQIGEIPYYQGYPLNHILNKVAEFDCWNRIKVIGRQE